MLWPSAIPALPGSRTLCSLAFSSSLRGQKRVGKPAVEKDRAAAMIFNHLAWLHVYLNGGMHDRWKISTCSSRAYAFSPASEEAVHGQVWWPATVILKYCCSPL